jgi:uncharacterized protein
MSTLVTALGLVLVIEGLAYAVIPKQLKSMMATFMTLPEEQLRLAGLVAASIGVGMIWIIRWMT